MKQQGLNHVTSVELGGYPLVYGVRENKQPAYEDVTLLLYAQVGSRYLQLSYRFSSNTETYFSLPWEDFLAEVLSRIWIDDEPADVRPTAAE